MRLSNELQIGKAGEYLTCADLIMKGFVAFPSEQGLPYDVVFDTGAKMIRVQVKSCAVPRSIPQRNQESFAYIFNVKRHGKNNQTVYDDGEVDLFALVALDTKQVGYIWNADMPETLNIRVDRLRGSYYDEKGIQDYAKVMQLKGSMSQIEISEKIGLANATVSRMCQPGYIPFKTNARYMSDLERPVEWFTK